jgi:hypothetical protein
VGSEVFLCQLGTTRKTERTRLQADYDRALRVVAEVRAPALLVWQGSEAVKRSLYGMPVPRLHIDLEQVSPTACRESFRIQAPVRE